MFLCSRPYSLRDRKDQWNPANKVYADDQTKQNILPGTRLAPCRCMLPHQRLLRSRTARPIDDLEVGPTTYAILFPRRYRCRSMPLACIERGRIGAWSLRAAAPEPEDQRHRAASRSQIWRSCLREISGSLVNQERCKIRCCPSS